MDKISSNNITQSAIDDLVLKMDEQVELNSLNFLIDLSLNNPDLQSSNVSWMHSKPKIHWPSWMERLLLIILIFKKRRRKWLNYTHFPRS